jgi:hypothetical protein
VAKGGAKYTRDPEMPLTSTSPDMPFPLTLGLLHSWPNTPRVTDCRTHWHTLVLATRHKITKGKHGIWLA